MPQMVMQRKFILRTIRGHTIAFERGKPVFVPDSCVKDALSYGAELLDRPADETTDEEALPKAPADPRDRRDAIKAVIEKMLVRNERNDFTAAGLPNPSVLNSLLGYSVHPREIADAWNDLHQEKDE